jgi:hypothetical protein
MTEKSGNRNPGKRDSQEHKAVDGGKKRRFIVSCARKKRRGERCQRCQISGQAREGVGMNMSKNFPEQSCNGCCVNQEVAILHLLERTSHFSHWVETKFEQLRSCTSLPSNAGLLEKGFLYLIDRRKTSQCRVACPLDLTRKLSLTGAIVGHSSAARIHRAIPQLSTADLSSSYVVDNEGGFHPSGASPPVPWSLRYAPEEERYVLKS